MKVSSFESLQDVVHNWAVKHRQRPQVIIMHPTDATKILRDIPESVGPIGIHDLMKYNGIEIIRSLDVAEGHPRIY